MLYDVALATVSKSRMAEAGTSGPWSFTIWGSRGSVSVATTDTRVHGGHTTCLELELPTARILIDAGSGLAQLGREKPHDGKETLLLFSHLHWDHVVGLPFYPPIFQAGWKLIVRGVPRSGHSVYQAVRDLNRPPIFPISLADAIRAEVDDGDLAENGSLDFHGVQVEWIEVEHPGGCSAFALVVDGRRFVFTGDVEISRADRPALVQFCRDAEVVICDAQYTPEEYANHRGWGHSTNIEAAELARDAGAGCLLLTHHDPTHDDAFIRQMVVQASRVFANTDAARAGMTVATSR